MMRATTPVKPTIEHYESAARISKRVERLLGPGEGQKQAWANFVHTNLAPGGRWNMPLLVDAAQHEFLDTNGQRVCCAFPVKSGTTDKFSKYEGGPDRRLKSLDTREKEEYPPLFEGSYTDHHSHDQRAPLVRGRNCDKYKLLMQTMLEAHLGIDDNTLVPEDVKEHDGTTTPLSWRFKWLDGGIVFSIECLEELHSIEGERKGNDRHFDFYALWTIRANTIRSD